MNEKKVPLKNMVWSGGLQKNICWRGIRSLIGSWKYFKKGLEKKGPEKKYSRGEVVSLKNYALFSW